MRKYRILFKDKLTFLRLDYKDVPIKLYLIVLRSKNYIKLENLAKTIKSKSNFIGRTDHQIIRSSINYNSDSLGVYDFLKKIK